MVSEITGLCGDHMVSPVMTTVTTAVMTHACSHHNTVTTTVTATTVMTHAVTTTDTTITTFLLILLPILIFRVFPYLIEAIWFEVEQQMEGARKDRHSQPVCWTIFTNDNVGAEIALFNNKNGVFTCQPL